MKANPFNVVIKNMVWKNDATMQIAISRHENLRLVTFDNEKEYQKNVLKWVERNKRYNFGEEGSCVSEYVMTFKEASEKYDVAMSTLRHRQRDGRFGSGDTRKSGNTWLVTKSAMDRIYGKED